MKRERLTMLADYLEGIGQFEGRGVPAKKFDLEIWNAPYEHFSQPFEIKRNPRKASFKYKTIKIGDTKYKMSSPVECQTAGCAVGWAVTIPEFIEQGFFLSEFQEPIYVDVDNYTYIGFDAVAEFFDITHQEVNKLFLDSSYKDIDKRNPLAVAKRIRSLVKTKTAKQYEKWSNKY